MTERGGIIERGGLFIVSGPSGAGKSTVIKSAMTQNPSLRFSVSMTTRKPRSGEAHGREYFFTDRDTFSDMAAGGELLEHAEYVGNLYGTPRAAVEETLKSGCSVILDIEVVGAAGVKAAMPEAVMIFLVPGGFSELEKRIRLRNQESEEKIRSRLDAARLEYVRAHCYDYVIINDDPEKAAAELLAIITAEGCRTKTRDRFLTLP